MNPPDLVPFTAFGGDWPAYETELHRIFITDIVNGGVQYAGLRVGCRRHPETAGKWASFCIPPPKAALFLNRGFEQSRLLIQH